MELNTINQLFLELSQFATAQTAEEIRLKNALFQIVEQPEEDDPSTTSMRLRLIAKEAIRAHQERLKNEHSPSHHSCGG